MLCQLISTPPPNPWQPLRLQLFLQFCLFHNVIQLKSCSIQPFQIGFFHVVMCMQLSFVSFPRLDSSFLLSTKQYFIVAVPKFVYVVVRSREAEALHGSMIRYRSFSESMPLDCQLLRISQLFFFFLKWNRMARVGCSRTSFSPQV